MTVKYGDSILAIGGLDAGREFLAAVERFDGHEWVEVEPMGTRRCTPAVVVYQGYVRAVSGLFFVLTTPRTPPGGSFSRPRWHPASPSEPPPPPQPESAVNPRLP